MTGTFANSEKSYFTEREQLV